MGNAALTFKQPSFAKLHGSKVNHEHLKIEVVEVEKHSTDSNEECKEECRSSSASSRSHSRSNAVLRRLSERRIRESIATPKRVDRVIELANNQDSEVSGISVLATTILRVIFEEAFDMDHSGRVSKDQFLFTLHNRPDVIPFLMSSLEEHQHSGCITAEEMFAELEKANHHSFITFNEFLAYFAPPKKFIEGCMAGTNLDYKALCSNAHWSYADPLTGPARWHTLSEKNKVAFEGRQQSPINILSFDVDEEVKPKPDTPRLSNGVVIKYNEKGEDPATITNSGYTIQVGWTPGDISVEGKLYRLSQFHFHSPAEHTVDNVQYALEMHLVHVSQQSELAVIGLLFKVGPKANPFFGAVLGANANGDQ
mmetsp:Transcript_27825/g.36209  ORF Transcript_27825/g.36209 Transcript_27825/m.36209 type:complete len:367 (+) Transcript_27825:118-1218(+)